MHEGFSQDSLFQKSLKEGPGPNSRIASVESEMKFPPLLPDSKICAAFEVFVNRDIGKALAVGLSAIATPSPHTPLPAVLLRGLDVFFLRPHPQEVRLGTDPG